MAGEAMPRQKAEPAVLEYWLRLIEWPLRPPRKVFVSGQVLLPRRTFRGMVFSRKPRQPRDFAGCQEDSHDYISRFFS
jgi:hypothetical protein